MAAIVHTVRASDGDALVAEVSRGVKAVMERGCATMVNVGSSMAGEISRSDERNTDGRATGQMVGTFLVGWRMVNVRERVPCSRLRHPGVAMRDMPQKEIAHTLRSEER